MRFARLFTVAAVLLAAPRPPEIPFDKVTLDLGANETCAFADVNKDGRLDVVSGENWYEAPNWKKHRFRDLHFENNYVDNFSDLPIDVDGDGFSDIVSCSWFQRKLAWWRNPGRAAGPWRETVIEQGAPIEFCFLVDLDNDGQARELLPQFGAKNAPLKWYALQNGQWQAHTVDKASHGHGIGAGDLNGDRKTDILTPDGWFEAPTWTFHAWPDLGSTGFLYVHDVNQDGRPDVVSSMAHDYGVFWLEQGRDGQFTKRVIDDSWSQAHALTLIDLNRDGRLDILTGKRYMAHNGKDPGEKEPLGLYWYEQAPGPKPNTWSWVRHVIDYSTRAGAGMQLPVADIDGDGDLDFAAGGKSGVYLFLNRTK